MRPVAWAMGSVQFSVRVYEVPSEPSEPSGTPRCFRRKLGSLLMDTFRTWKRSPSHPAHSFNLMVLLHLKCQKNLHCHHVCLQRTSLEDELKYWMSAESEESTVIQSQVMRIAHLKEFPTLRIDLTGMGSWIIGMTVKAIAGRTSNWI